MDGTYGINSNGNLCPTNEESCDETKEIKINMAGTKPSGGSVVISNGKVQSAGTKIKIENYDMLINNDGKTVVYRQVYKPQYYGDWYFSGVVESSDAPLEAERLKKPPADNNLYVEYDVDNGKISVGYVCFKRSSNGPEYCLKGYDASAYTSNKDIIAMRIQKWRIQMLVFSTMNILLVIEA